ncbi:single-stranded DNA-binding protein [Brachybacterium sp. FME24]|uniref:single-stranded DNA-binding protein n=1 Tax=Brachybacterium sp. FME24 TaxID=2742605 RepID=UPI00186914DD|nr:single-stranded DNA-binding protein [Brachybacterium sp. FME24]
MAQISFEGRITADAEIKYGNDGKPRASFSVAENFRAQNRQTQEWEDSGVTFHNVTLFGRLAESAPLTKGQVVTVAGTQKSRAYTNNAGEQKQWTETTTNTVGVVPIPPRAGAASPSPQGEQFNPQYAPQQPEQQGFAQQGWPQATQPGQGRQQGYGLTDPPF